MELFLASKFTTYTYQNILPLRSLLVYLYSQLELLVRKEATVAEQEELPNNKSNNRMNMNQESIFEKCPDNPELFRVKPEYDFHLFITTSPCGDARIFSLHEGREKTAAVNNNNNMAVAPAADVEVTISSVKKEEDEVTVVSPSASTASLNENNNDASIGSAKAAEAEEDVEVDKASDTASNSQPPTTREVKPNNVQDSSRGMLR